jgi:hypothetical protein
MEKDSAVKKSFERFFKCLLLIDKIKIRKYQEQKTSTISFNMLNIKLAVIKIICHNISHMCQTLKKKDLHFLWFLFFRPSQNLFTCF